MNQAAFLSQLRQSLNRHGVGDIDDILADFEEHFATGKAMGKDEEAIATELGDPLEIAAQYAGEQPLRDRSTGTGAQPGGSGGPSQPRREAGASGGYVYVEDSRGKPRAPSGQPWSQTAAGSGTTRTTGTTDVPGGGGTTGTGGWDSKGPTGATGVTGADGYVRTEPAPITSWPEGSRPQAQPTGADGYARTDAGHVPIERSDSSAINTVLLVLLGLFVILPAGLAAIGLLIGLWAAAFGVGAGAIALFIAAATEVGTATLILILFAISMAALSILLFIGAYWMSRLFALGIRAYVRWNRQVAKGGVNP